MSAVLTRAIIANLHMGVSPEVVQLLTDLHRGCDIYSYTLAKRYRELEAHGLVQITPPMQATNFPVEPQPFFGCVRTKAGNQVLWRARKERKEYGKGGTR